MTTLKQSEAADLLIETRPFLELQAATTVEEQVSSPEIGARGSSRELLVSLIIPTLNEARNLPKVLSELPLDVHEILVVDGHSTDNTKQIVEDFDGPTRFVTQPGIGKGDALRHGFALATGDVVITFDADGSADPAEIPAFVRAIASGAEAALGSRYMFGGGSEDITLLRSSGNRLLRTAANIAFSSNFTDLAYGYNAFSAHATQELVQLGGGFEIETVNRLMVLRAGLPWIEVPSVERNRLFGNSNLRPFHAGLRILRSIIALRLMPGSRHKRRGHGRRER